MRLFSVLLLVLGACMSLQPTLPSPDTGYIDAPVPRSGDRIGPVAEWEGNLTIGHLGWSREGVLALARDPNEGHPPVVLLRFDETQQRFLRIWLPTAGLRGSGGGFDVGADSSAWIALDGGAGKGQTLFRVRPDGFVEEWPIPPVAYPRNPPDADAPRIYPQIAALAVVGDEVFVARHEQLELTIFRTTDERWEQPQTPPHTGVITSFTKGPEGRLYFGVDHRVAGRYGNEVGILDTTTRGVRFWEVNLGVRAAGPRSVVAQRAGELLRLDAAGTVTASTPLERPTHFGAVLLRSDDVAVRQLGWEMVHYDTAGREIGRVSWAPPERFLRSGQPGWSAWTKAPDDTIWFAAGRQLYRASVGIVEGKAVLRDPAPPVHPVPAAVRCDVPAGPPADPAAGAVIRAAGWSADGRSLLVELVSGRGRIASRRGAGVLDVESGRVRVLAPDGIAPRWSASGRLVAYKIFQSPTGPGIAETIVIADPRTGSEIARLAGTAGVIAWSGDALRYVAGGTIREWRDGTDRAVAPITLSTGATVPEDVLYSLSPDGERLLAERWVRTGPDASVLEAIDVARADDGVLRPVDPPGSAHWTGAHTLFMVRGDRYELRDDAAVRTIQASALPGAWLGAFDDRGHPLFASRQSISDELTIGFTRATPWDGEGLGAGLLVPHSLGADLLFAPGGVRVAVRSRLFLGAEVSIFRCR